MNSSVTETPRHLSSSSLVSFAWKSDSIATVTSASHGLTFIRQWTDRESWTAISERWKCAGGSGGNAVGIPSKVSSSLPIPGLRTLVVDLTSCRELLAYSRDCITFTIARCALIAASILNNARRRVSFENSSHLMLTWKVTPTICYISDTRICIGMRSVVILSIYLGAEVARSLS